MPATAKPAKKPKIKRYAFDVTGQIYHCDKYTPEQWEALKAKLGAVVEIEAANKPDAYKLYEEVKRKGKV